MNTDQILIFSQSSPVQIVRKEIRRGKNQTKEAYDETFRNEYTCLLLLDRLAHPNIIPLLGSYTYGDRHNFLFPAFEKDLRDFLNSEVRFGDFCWSSTFFSALRGLASALCSTHKLHLNKEKHGLDIDAIGYHHDLRPANVLVSRKTFILADFGLGKFKPEDNSSKTWWKVGEGDYLAPECMNESFVHQRVGRAIDVWAFGCLTIEVIIYMIKGAASLKEFRKLRISPGRFERWEESCFHDKNGNPKLVVLQWLESLTRDQLRPGPVSMLADISRKALKREPKDRPIIEEICADLTLISLKAYLDNVCLWFSKYMEQHTAPWMERTSMGMKLWFESERLAAFGYVTGLDNDKLLSMTFSDLNCNYDAYLEALKTLLIAFQEAESEGLMLKPDATSWRENRMEREDCARRHLEKAICEQVESLWSLLPLKEKRKAETAWLQAMLNTKDVRRLENVERAFRDEDDSVYEKGAAMAMMKKIGLEMKSNPTGMPEGFIVSGKDVQRQILQFCCHEIGLFKETHVLIEWMNYSSGWENISPEQRAVTISLKAQGFSKKTRPAGMRTLDCIGAFENIGRKPGYGFLYQIPRNDLQVDIASSTTTLLQLIENKACQPLLGNKLRLASALAQFLGDFHNVGWLHENFNPNNVLFFNISSSEQSSSNVLAPQSLEQPYVVGLHKSRLGGNNWHTAGPASRGDFQDYQHPEYARTGRYRATYDYYSLGLILMELGFWRPLHVWTKCQSYSRMSLTEFRQELIRTQVPLLGISVGAVYRDAVQFCLGRNTDSSEDLDIATLQDFANNVVDPLKELAEVSI